MGDTEEAERGEEEAAFKGRGRVAGEKVTRGYLTFPAFSFVEPLPTRRCWVSLIDCSRVPITASI